MKLLTIFLFSILTTSTLCANELLPANQSIEEATSITDLLVLASDDIISCTYGSSLGCSFVGETCSHDGAKICIPSGRDAIGSVICSCVRY